MNKQIFTIALCLFSIISTIATAQSYSGGSGTGANPYLISSKADMQALAAAVNGNSSYSTGKYFLLTQDITEAITTIIGNSSDYPFRGNFDGGGHFVTVNISTSANYAGVFGYAPNAAIKNLGVKGSVTRTVSSSVGYAGGICGYGSTITNCYNTGNISSSSSSSYASYAYAGGICGVGSPVNCYNTGNISSSSSSSSYPSSSYAYAGGICGAGTIKNCIATNTTITCSGSSSAAGRITGSGTVQNCYALATMKINGSTRSSSNENSNDGKDWLNESLSFITCAHAENSILLITTNPLKWQRSSDNGNTWLDIACTDFYYTETDPSAGHYIYRAQNGNGTFSPYAEVTYYDAVPATINTLPLTETTKTVDESITFSLELQDNNYNYQWYKDNTAIAGATSNTFAVDIIKSSHAGVYKCKIWNGCNEVYSGTSTLTVNKSPQVITFPEIPIKTYGDEAITLPEKTDKGLTITYQSINTNVATVSGNILTIKNPGTSTIIASQAGNVDYLLAPVVERTLTVNKQTQTITFGEIAAKRYGDPTFNLPAATDKGLTISYRVINTNVATVAGNTVTIHNSGTTDIIASQAGDAYRYAATPVTQTLTVQKANQSITFADFDAKIYGDPNIELNRYSDAGLEIIYTSDNADVATINGHTIVLHNAGSAQITAAQSGNGNYNPAPPITRTLIIGKAGQTIVWDNIEPKTYGDDDFYLPASTDKGLNIAYSIENENIAAVTGNKLHITGAGTTNVTASQVGNNNYFPASPVTLTLTVSKALQTITFNELADKTYGDPAFELQANVNSNLPVTLESSNTNVATVSGNMLTIVNAGTAYITASVAGNNNYYTANPVQQQLTVNKATQTIALDIIPNKTYGDAAFALNAQMNTVLPVTYTSSDPSKLFISGNQATIFGAGSFTVTATQSGNNNYLPVSDSKMFVVNKANLTVSAENKERYYGDENPILTYIFNGFVNGDSKVDLQTAPVIVCAAEQISPVGSYPINVSGASDNNYNFIYQSAQLTVNKAPLTIKPHDVTRKYGENNPAFVLAYSGFKNGENENILPEKPVAVTSARATSDVGIYDIFVSGGSANNYDFIYQNGSLSIEKALLNVVVDDKKRTYGDENPQLTYSLVGFKNSDNLTDINVLPVVSTGAVNSSVVGNYPIEANNASDNNYDFAYFAGNLQIEKASLAITAENKVRQQGEDNPSFTLLYSGFKNNETESVLDELPTISCEADKNSPVGFYDITLSGGNDNNYNYTLVNGTLEVTILSGIKDVNVEISVYISNNGIQITGCNPSDKVGIYTVTGQMVYSSVIGNGFISYPFQKGMIYIIHTPKKSLKVIY